MILELDKLALQFLMYLLLEIVDLVVIEDVSFASGLVVEFPDVSTYCLRILSCKLSLHQVSLDELPLSNEHYYSVIG